jgi:hypothetical protein
MIASLVQMFDLFTQPTGSVIYHLVLVFSIVSALQSSIFHLRASGFPQARRTVFGLSFLLSAQIALFVLSALGNEGIINLALFLPPVDRALTLFALVWMIWLWTFPEPSRPADAATALFTLLVAAAFALSLIAYSQTPNISYNLTIFESYWQIGSIGMAVFGLFLLLVRRPNGWGNGMAIFLLAFAGHLLHLIFGRVDGDFPGAVRLAYMAAYPILMTLAQRFPAPAQTPTTIKPVAPSEERRRYSTDPKTFHALLALAAESSVDKVSQAITRAIAQTMLADLSFLIYLTDNNHQMQIASGYDLIREENLEGGSLNKNLIPMLTNSIQRGRPLRLPSSSTSADIKGLSDLLGLNTPGHLMSVPIVTPEKDVIGGVLVLSPYSNRLWSAEDQAFLSNIATSLVPIIQRGQKMNALERAGRSGCLDRAGITPADVLHRGLHRPAAGRIGRHPGVAAAQIRGARQSLHRADRHPDRRHDPGHQPGNGTDRAQTRTGGPEHDHRQCHVVHQQPDPRKEHHPAPRPAQEHAVHPCDREALQQILIHLLQNAGAVSPTKARSRSRSRPAPRTARNTSFCR